MRWVRVMGAVLLAIALAACAANPQLTPLPEGTGGPASSSSTATPGDGETPPATVPGHELYGFLPYWEMDDEGIVEHVAAAPLTTLALFSVTHTATGAINTSQRGHAMISSDTGSRLVRGAHDRGIRVELVYTSFGGPRNRKLLERDDLQATVIASLVAYAGDLGVDGINVDIEALDPTLVPAFGGFVADLRAAITAADPAQQVSVSTGAHALGAAMAVAAAAAGADRIFMMGYDYRTGRSDPGASAPLDRRDGENQSLRTSLDLYAALGVPPDRLLLGLPLYGVEWPVVGPVIGAPSTDRGAAWFPRANVPLLSDPGIVPLRDDIEQVEVYLLGSDGTVGPPSIDPAAPIDPSAPVEPWAPVEPAVSPAPDRTWRAIYVDSPETLAPKMALANERGLAGSGFWAIGYERGLPGYTRLMERFVAGEPLP
ncbi:MAG TPA: glycosyl hydrolase family 18 protein [Candidatus Limnocylindrales bacterium]|nr:glycosyl hydrolase family 18 protein [Candidatus Limnocylindrales bacterium]